MIWYSHLFKNFPQFHLLLSVYDAAAAVGMDGSSGRWGHSESSGES